MSDNNLINLLRRRLPHIACSFTRKICVRTNAMPCPPIAASLVVNLSGNAGAGKDYAAVMFRSRRPRVARGAGTGLAGGALPLTDGVLLSLARLNRILDIDVNNRTARVEPA
jgi:glycolate oxidase